MSQARPEAPKDQSRSGITLRLIGKAQCLDATGLRWLDLQPKAGALLATLAVDQAVPRALLATRLWPEAGDDKPRANLRGLLRDVRKLCGRELVTGHDTLELAPGVVHDLQALAGALHSLDDIASGELLGSHDYTELDAFNEWLERARDRWRVARQRAVAALATRLESTGHGAEALQAAQRLVADDALDESGWRLLMMLLAARGERVAALSAYARCQAALRQGLGAEVAPATRALATSIELGQAAVAIVERTAQAGPASMVPAQLVGRGAEMAAIAAAWRDGRHVLLEGEPGIGKSRIVQALSTADGAAGALLRSGTRVDDAEVPFSTLLRALHVLLAHARPVVDAPTAAELARLLPQFGSAATHPARTRELAQALAAALQAWRAQGVEALLIDDLQWADGASLSLLLPALGAELQAPRRGPKMLLALRTGQRPSALAEVVAAAPHDWSAIALGPLGEAELRGMLDAMPLALNESQAWVRTLAPRAMGNPLHLIETVAALRHALGDRVFRQAPPPAAQLPAPAALDALVQARLARLPDAQRHLAQLVALAGDLFSVALAREVMGVNELELGTLWSLLEEAQVLKGAALAHDTLRDPLLAALPAPVAVELHARVARHGQAHGGAAAEIARHWWRAQDWPAAATAFGKAAVQARAVNARGDELRLWDQAARAHERRGDAAAAHAARCHACEAALAVEPAQDALMRAEALQGAAVTDLQQLDASLAVAGVAYMNHGLAQLLQAGTQAAGLARRLLQQRALDADDTRVLQAACAFSLGLAFAGRITEALHELDRLADVAARCPHAQRRLRYHEARGTVLSLAGHGEAAMRELEQALTLARATEDAAEMQQQLINVGSMRSRLGRYRGALELARESVALNQRLGETRSLIATVTRMSVAGFCGRLGRYAEAVGEMRAAMAAFGEAGALTWMADCECHLALILLDLGCLEQARAVMQTTPAAGDHALVRGIALLRLAHASGQNVLAQAEALAVEHAGTRMENRVALALLAARDRAPPAAVLACEQALGDCESMGALGAAQHARALSTHALHRAGHLERAAVVARQVVASLDDCQPHSMYLPEAWWFSAQALQAAGDHPAAALALRRARAWVEETALPHVPKAQRRRFLEDNPINRQLLAAASTA